MVARAKVRPAHKGVVLVVEDEPLIRTCAANFFVEAGYEVLQAGSASQALTILENRDDILAVFTDIEMPGPMNGLGLAASISERWNAIAILITSGRLCPPEHDLPVGAGFIGKPYRTAHVLGKIEALVAERSSPQHAPQ
ncbi:MAG TPA: response regulator [Novosphingobium sp.]|jgi:DNA-binding response OmpR family regulator|nr:response regulator [Novosphingobium sp.]